MKKLFIFTKFLLIIFSINAFADTSEKLEIAKRNYCEALKEYLAQLEPEADTIKKKFRDGKKLELPEKARIGVFSDYKIQYQKTCLR